MITPKATFSKSAHGKEWTNLMDSARFEAGAQAAMAQMQIECGFPTDMPSAAARQYEMQGAKRFLETLMNLALPENKPAQQTSKNLRQT